MVLPSIHLLQRMMTSKVKKLQAQDFLRSMLQELSHRECLLLVDEINIKVGLPFSGDMV